MFFLTDLNFIMSEAGRTIYLRFEFRAQEPEKISAKDTRGRFLLPGVSEVEKKPQALDKKNGDNTEKQPSDDDDDGVFFGVASAFDPSQILSVSVARRSLTPMTLFSGLRGTPARPSPDRRPTRAFRHRFVLEKPIIITGHLVFLLSSLVRDTSLSRFK